MGGEWEGTELLREGQSGNRSAISAVQTLAAKDAGHMAYTPSNWWHHTNSRESEESH